MRSAPATLVLITAVAIAGCGGAGSDRSHGDAGNPDSAGAPPPPAIGAQIDRAGRAAIRTMLIGVFTPEPTRTALRNAYSQASDPATWKSTMLPNGISIERELETNLAAFDILDKGLTLVTPAGCGNAIRYNPPPSGTAYIVTADLFADDQLYVDTANLTCNVYLDLELEYGSFGMVFHNECGGRMPTHDAIDMTYSVLAAGNSGIDLFGRSPLIHDGVAVHTDVKDRFPFLGSPR